MRIPVDELTLVTLPLPQSRSPDGPRQAAFYKRVLDGVRQRPGIGAAALLFPPTLPGHERPRFVQHRGSRGRSGHR